jgi:hypothetical protein
MDGYNEIQVPPARYAIIDQRELHRLCGIPDPERFKKEYRQWVDDALTGGSLERESSWSESVAVGRQNFIEEIKTCLRVKAIGRKIRGQGGTMLTLRECPAAYNAHFATEKGSLSLKNTYFGDIN